MALSQEEREKRILAHFQAGGCYFPIQAAVALDMRVLKPETGEDQGDFVGHWRDITDIYRHDWQHNTIKKQWSKALLYHCS